MRALSNILAHWSISSCLDRLILSLLTCRLSHDPVYGTGLGKIDKGDERIDFQGYGYIIEGFNVKCCGKVPYTITFYSLFGI